MSFSLLTRSEQVWESVLADIRNAQKSIDIELFIIDVDDIGLSLINLLRQKSREGIKVRLLVDAGGSFVSYLSNLTNDLKADSIHFFLQSHPSVVSEKYSSLVFPQPSSLDYYRRTHHVSRGACFSENMRGWRDLMIRLEGITEPIKDIHSAYDRMWLLSEKLKFGKNEQNQLNKSGPISQTPLFPEEDIYTRDS